MALLSNYILYDLEVAPAALGASPTIPTGSSKGQCLKTCSHLNWIGTTEYLLPELW